MMRLTEEEIERGLRALGLDDPKIREALSRLTRITRPKPAGPAYETTTARHTLWEAEGRPSAEKQEVQ